MSFRDGVDGHTVPLHVGYTLDPDGSVSTTHNTQGTDLSFSYIQRAGAQTFEPVLVPRVPLPADRRSRRGHRPTTRSPWSPATPPCPTWPAATFASSEPMLDAVWALCAHSGLYTSQEQFIDTPTREKGQFLWDAANESETVMRAFGEQNLSWQGLRDMARAQARYWPTTGQVNEVYPNDDGPQNYPTFTARYPEWVWRYYLSTGDRATRGRPLPDPRPTVGLPASGPSTPSTGLISGQPMSTNGDNEYGYDYNTNADTTLNILAVNAFRRIGDVATLLGDAADGRRSRPSGRRRSPPPSTPTWWGRRALRGRAAGRRASRAPTRRSWPTWPPWPTAWSRPRRIADGGGATSPRSTSRWSPTTGWSCCGPCTPAGATPTWCGSSPTPRSRAGPPSSRPGGTFTWETWTPSDLIGDSMSHGWGSSALVAMQEVLLGAVPTASRIRRAAHPGDGHPAGRRARPTPRDVPDAGGAVLGGLAAPAAADRACTITVPANAAAQCRLPGRRRSPG